MKEKEGELLYEAIDIVAKQKAVPNLVLPVPPAAELRTDVSYDRCLHHVTNFSPTPTDTISVLSFYMVLRLSINLQF